MKRILSVFLAVIIVFGFSSTAFAENDLAQNVTAEMCKPGYWKSRTFTDADEVLMTPDDIRAFNENAYQSSGTYIVGIEKIKETYNADYQRSIMQFDVPSRTLYINGQVIDKVAYYNKINQAILNTGYTETVKETEYAIVVRQTDMKYIPTLDVIGYSATDSDDEMEYENLCVNEPFAVRAMCIIDGVKFFYGWSTDCVGWVPADDLAICSSKQEWLDAWYNEIEADDFIVITQDKLNLEPSLYDKDLSNLKLTLGTSLKLVSEDKKPVLVDGRNTWHNYVVYIPVRDADGHYAKKTALIPEHYSVSIGYLPFTQANLLDIAFTCLGNRYGWAGMLDSYDCSLYTRTIYRCFGLTYPRNGNWQENVSGTKIDLSKMNDEEKQMLIETLPTGTTMFFSGHTMMYLGTDNSISYVISALGTAVESTGSNDVKTVYNIAVTPLTMRRGASYGYTSWLHNLSSVVMVMPKTDISKCEVTAFAECDGENPSVCVKTGDKELYENINYTVTYEDGIAIINGINNYSGSVSVDIEKKHTDADGNGRCDKCNEMLKTNLFTRFFSKIIEFFKKIFRIML